jgi:apolipoprotein N-acyltransferase
MIEPAVARLPADSLPRTVAPRHHRGRGLVVAAFGGACMALSVPPWGWWPLAFVAVALWDRALAHVTARTRFVRSFVLGACWLLPTTFWMWDFTAVGYLVSGAAFSAYVGVAGVLVPGDDRRSWVRWLALPGALVLCEAARWSFPFEGVPLATVAMGQAAAPLGQVARIGSAIGVVMVVGVGGVALSAAWERRWRVAGATLAAVVLVWGVALVAPRGHATGELTVALVQGGGPQGTRAADSDPYEVFERHLVASSGVRTPVDLVLWPENVIEVEAPYTDSREHRELTELARRLRTTLVVGATEGLDAERFANFSVVYDAEGELGDRYDKQRRVPFGEYVPLRSFVESIAGPFVDSMEESGAGLTRRDAVVGEGPAVLETDVGTFAVAISWEIFFADGVREAVQLGGEVVLNPTNGSSYWLTQVQTQQVASSQLRAVETGRWVLQAAPTGFSAVVDPEGGVVIRTAVSEQRVLQETVEERSGDTIATIVGPWPTIGLAAAVVTAAWIVALGERRRAERPVPAGTDPVSGEA